MPSEASSRPGTTLPVDDRTSQNASEALPLAGTRRYSRNTQQREATMTGYHNPPPANYQTPRFPSLNIKTVYDYSDDRRYTLYYVNDVWRFTVIWTLIVYALFHLGAVMVAMLTHGWRISSWKYLWAVPIVYLVIAGLEAIFAGSIVGVVLGAVYSAGYYEMNTWIPCTWAFISVLILIISSFTIQGGL